MFLIELNESPEFKMAEVDTLIFFFFPPKKCKGESKEAYRRGLGGNKQAVRQAGRLSFGFRGQLVPSSLLGSHRGGFLYAHLLQTPPPLLCSSGSSVYLLAPPPGSVLLPDPFHGARKVQKLQARPRCCLSAQITCFSVLVHVWGSGWR